MLHLNPGPCISGRGPLLALGWAATVYGIHGKTLCYGANLLMYTNLLGNLSTSLFRYTAS